MINIFVLNTEFWFILRFFYSFPKQTRPVHKIVSAYLNIKWVFRFRFFLYTLLISLGAILNFSMYDVIRERSYTWQKWLPQMKALLTLILQGVFIKRKVFTLYQEEYFLYTVSLWVCYHNCKALVQRYSWIDGIEDKRELI